MIALAKGEYTADRHRRPGGSVLFRIPWFFIIFILIFFIVIFGRARRMRGIAANNDLPFWMALILANMGSRHQRGKWVVITAIPPTGSGEGKTTVAIGLGMAMIHIGRKGIVALRQPSLGPLFGMKGGGTGGGKAMLLPQETINLGLTGDNYRVNAAHNLLSSFTDNHIYRNSPLDIDPADLYWPRTVNINDRSVREIIVGANEKPEGFPQNGWFVLTEASEVM